LLVPLKHGVPTIAEGLNQLFGESLTKRAVASFTEKFERNRQAGLVGFSKNNVGLAVTPASAALVTRFVPRNTFHGDYSGLPSDRIQGLPKRPKSPG